MENNNLYEVPKVTIRLKVEEGQSLYLDKNLDSPQAAVLAMSDMMSDLDREHLSLLCLDARNRVICWNIVSIGDIDSAIVSIPNIYKNALLANAKSIMIFHNHPSSVVEASKEDVEVTKRIIEAGKIMGIGVLDHIIIGGYTGEYFSMRENQTGNLYFHEKENRYVVNETAPSDWRAARKEKMDALMEQLENGVKNIFESGQFENYLKTMARFPRYSYRNTVLIHMQNPKASYVCGYERWKDFGRNVMKGQKAIKIIAPMKYKQDVEQEKRDPVTGRVIFDKNGEVMKETVSVERIGFKIENTFDVSQTSGKPLPAICHNLEGDVKRYDQFMQAVRKVSKVPIEFAPLTGKDGFYSLVEKKIVLRDDMSQKQTMSAVIHELSHSVLHDLDMENLEQSIKERNRDTRTMEVEADAISAVVNYYFENEVGDNNFGYIASWSKDKELPELYASLQVIRDTASAFIDDISKELTKIRLQEIQNDPFLSTGDNRFALYQLDENTEEIHYRFKNTAYMERNDIHVRTGDYRQVYSGELTEEMTLDSIYEQFNMDHPSDFHGHSLSISDVIATRMDGVERAFYVDNFGFKELPNFIEHLRSPEMVLPERRMEKTGDISKEFANYGQNRNKEKENTPDKMKQAGKTVSKQVPSAYGIKI